MACQREGYRYLRYYHFSTLISNTSQVEEMSLVRKDLTYKFPLPTSEVKSEIFASRDLAKKTIETLRKEERMGKDAVLIYANGAFAVLSPPPEEPTIKI